MRNKMMLQLLGAVALCAMAAGVQAQTHVTIEKADVAFNFPTAQDVTVNHFEFCATQAAVPILCAPSATFAPITVVSKAADPAQPGQNLYHAALPVTIVPNKAGESTTLVVRACTGAAVAAGCGGLSAGVNFLLDLSSPSNLVITQKP